MTKLFKPNKATLPPPMFVRDYVRVGSFIVPIESYARRREHWLLALARRLLVGKPKDWSFKD